MNVDASFIVAPLIGGFIGYITNAIAIKMLFRPHTAKYCFGVHIPLTPGIIPKEKGRIAEAIGGVISENLMNKEVLEKYLLSDEMVGKLRRSVEEFIEKLKVNEETVRQFLSHYLSDEEIEALTNNVNRSLTTQIETKLSDSAVGDKVAHIVVEHVITKMRGIDPSEFFTGIATGAFGIPGAILSLFGSNILGKFFSMLRQPAEQLLANNINDMIRNNGTEIVSGIISEETTSFLDTKVCKLLEGKDEQLAQAPGIVENIYRTVITEHLPRILETVDISKIVCGRINEMDISETERLIYQVMDKELKAIVWLGAVLGLIMGVLNAFLTTVM